jgi:hypothetical protein
MIDWSVKWSSTENETRMKDNEHFLQSATSKEGPIQWAILEEAILALLPVMREIS